MFTKIERSSRMVSAANRLMRRYTQLPLAQRRQTRAAIKAKLHVKLSRLWGVELSEYSTEEKLRDQYALGQL